MPKRRGKTRTYDVFVEFRGGLQDTLKIRATSNKNARLAAYRKGATDVFEARIRPLKKRGRKRKRRR